MKKIVALSLVVFLLCGVLFAGGKQEQKPAGKKWRIALSNDYAGNSWRQQMLKDWKSVVEKAKAQGLIAEGPAFTTNESSAAEQAAQIQNLILEGYDAIVLDAASPTALNAAVKKAIEAGIPVISFDNAITEPSAYRLITDFEYYGRSEVEYLATRLPNGGNVLEIRGLAGTYVNDAIHAGIMEGIKKYPQFKIVGEVYGNWTESVAQKEVAGILPSLPKIDAVVTQGGDGYGAVKAFEAAGRPIPIVFMGNRYDELEIWKELKTKTGWDTSSCTISPSVVQIAFWVALEVLNGEDVPKEIKLPPLTIPGDKLDYFLAHTEKGGVASIEYPQSWVKELIKNAKAGKPAPADPLPQ
ncbi:MAG TPA: ABC transporter substrate-binding protein [Spirochaetales bacterium]|nr:ABC transporter substrate-binding protein [Spirochaetales bacterium]